MSPPGTEPAAPLVLGTAGHIDHGKTALIRALTGKDTDRLPEEHRRGISIELGYAALTLPSGRRVSVVDSPGHERFVRTMVAGATGIDAFLLCVAADDGVMPQTREHLAVLRQLGVSAGVAAITKADLVDPEPALEELASLLPDVPAVPVSARERTGLEELGSAIERVAGPLAGRAGSDEAARLHVDRSFSLKGIGTVVTGTLWAGEVARGEWVRLLPGGTRARVRSVQVHDAPVERAVAGQRVALNLAGLGRREIGRGDVVVGEGAAPAPTYLIDAALALEPGARALERGTRVQVHHGTREAPARVVLLAGESIAPGAGGYAQLRLESALVPAGGDRLVIRQIAPPDTIGGGSVIDPAPRKHGPSAAVVGRLAARERGEPPPGDAEPEAPVPAAPRPPELDGAALGLAELLRADGREPRTDADLAAAAGLSPAEAAARLRELERAGRVVRVARNLHFDREALATLTTAAVSVCEEEGEVTIAGVRDRLGTSRKYAQALLEHMDAQRITVRRGDAHVLRRRA